MAVEIERKFLLCNEQWRAQVQRTLPMSQAYLGGDQCSVRVRVSGEQAWLNIKSAIAGPSRLEFEYEVPLSDAREMMRLAVEPSIDKVRHIVEHGGFIWEIDEFAGRNQGLIVAEIELPSVDTRFARPLWVGEEVTEQRRYYNSALAKRPFDSWDQP